MNELSLRQRPGDGIDPTVMSLQRQGEERELYETSHSFVCPLPLCQPPLFSTSVMGSYYSRLVTYPPDPHPRGNPHPPEMLPLANIPSPSLPCPALPNPACSSPVDFGPSRKKKIPISRSRSGTQAEKAANSVHVCADMCVYMCVPPSEVGSRLTPKGREMKVQRGGNIVITLRSPVHYPQHGSMGSGQSIPFYCTLMLNISLSHS